MPYDLNTSIQLALHVRAAEAIDSGDAPIYQPPGGYALLSPLYANDLATQQSPQTDYVPFGYVARQANSVVIAIRGTDHIWEWVDDIQFLKVRCPIPNSMGQTEDGFTDVFSSLRIDHDNTAPSGIDYIKSVLRPGDSLAVCGHSLGAALATLFAYDLGLNVIHAGLQLYTFASPNVGDGAFANSFAAAVPNAYRVVNPFDVVTHVPTHLLLGYDAVGETHQYNPAGQVKTDILCYHHLTTYLHLMSVAAQQVPPVPLDPECIP